jgi:hypothetical protein
MEGERGWLFQQKFIESFGFLVQNKLRGRISGFGTQNFKYLASITSWSKTLKVSGNFGRNKGAIPVVIYWILRFFNTNSTQRHVISDLGTQNLKYLAKITSWWKNPKVSRNFGK